MPQGKLVDSHSAKDVMILTQMWLEHASAHDIARLFGVHFSTVYLWAKHYNLPKRERTSCQKPLAAPTPEEEEASLSGLALSPLVEQRAREMRERHYAERMAEGDETSRSKAWSWRRGETKPQGARHDK